MAIQFACHDCGSRMEAPDSRGGTTCRCPSCRATLHIPPTVEALPNTAQDQDLSEHIRNSAEDAKGSSWLARRWILVLGVTSLLVLLTSVGLAIARIFPTFGLLWPILAGLIGLAVALLATVIRGITNAKCRQEDQTSMKFYRRGLVAGILLLLLAMWMTKHSAYGWWVLLHYVCLGVLIIVVGMVVSSFWKSWWISKVTLFLVVSGLLLWWQFDYYSEDWSKVSEITGNTSRYTDYFRRRSETPYYREYSLSEGKKFLPIYRSQGHLTDTGKQHGRWSWSRADWDNFNHETGNDFFWYGQQITEGEWHLRNK